MRLLEQLQAAVKSFDEEVERELPLAIQTAKNICISVAEDGYEWISIADLFNGISLGDWPLNLACDDQIFRTKIIEALMAEGLVDDIIDGKNCLSWKRNVSA